jgi:hypothetical protein
VIATEKGIMMCVNVIAEVVLTHGTDIVIEEQEEKRIILIKRIILELRFSLELSELNQNY